MELTGALLRANLRGNWLACALASDRPNEIKTKTNQGEKHETQTN
jgi:hypothetical protein